MDSFTDNIDRQIEFNRDKNILAGNLEIFQFAGETLKAASDTDSLDADSIQFLIAYAADKAIEEFCRVNQYYSFDAKAIVALRKIYADLFESFRIKTESPEDISKRHYEKLKAWIKESNPFAEKMYKDGDKTVIPVTCSEYSPDLQMHVLRLDMAQALQPVLDIGCGKHGQLVSYLRNRGIEAYGIDRFTFTDPDLQTADWLEYDYGKGKWGTIVSNLGFSNHFSHHHLREDGNYIGYGKAYMNILTSLKVGGCFHYAPDLPFIEKYLDPAQIELTKSAPGEYAFTTTIIKKL